jgi:hypothetical protein
MPSPFATPAFLATAFPPRLTRAQENTEFGGGGGRARTAVSFRVRAFRSCGDRTVDGRARARGDAADEPSRPSPPSPQAETPPHPLPYYPLLS